MVNDDRGQLILIGALLVAATILGSITLLNTIHESPEVKTQQDARSLQDTERKMAEVRSNLERLFLYNVSVNETGEPLPYATNSTFSGIVEEYERQSMNLSSKTSAGVLDVTYLDGGSMNGSIARQNETDSGYQEFPSSDIIRDANSVPRLFVFINRTDAASEFNITIKGDTYNVTLAVQNDEISIDGTKVCDRDSKTEELTLDFIDGSGEIRTADNYCGDIDLGAGLDPEYTVEFENTNSAEGTFIITGTDIGSDDTGLSLTDPNRFYGDDYIVNPKFEVTYQTPNVAYNSTFALYNSTGR